MGAEGQIMRELLFSGETNESRQLGWRLQELPWPVSLSCCVCVCVAEGGGVLLTLLSVGNGRIATFKQNRKNLLGGEAAFSLCLPPGSIVREGSCEPCGGKMAATI